MGEPSKNGENVSGVGNSQGEKASCTEDRQEGDLKDVQRFAVRKGGTGDALLSRRTVRMAPVPESDGNDCEHAAT